MNTTTTKLRMSGRIEQNTIPEHNQFTYETRPSFLREYCNVCMNTDALVKQWHHFIHHHANVVSTGIL